MPSPAQNQENREISLSSDKCKCPLCKAQLEHPMNNKKSLPSIHFYHHLKKRQGPPVKKESGKDSSFRPKASNKELTATPNKNKADRSKQAYAVMVSQEYHMVSHSQRVKTTKDENEIKREERIKPKGRVNFETERLAEISENPENKRALGRNIAAEQRGKVDASPNFFKGSNRNQRELK